MWTPPFAVVQGYDIRRIVATRFVLRTNGFTVRLVSCICRSSSQKLFQKESFFMSILVNMTAASVISSKNDYAVLCTQMVATPLFMTSRYLRLPVHFLPFGVVSAALVRCKVLPQRGKQRSCQRPHGGIGNALSLIHSLLFPRHSLSDIRFSFFIYSIGRSTIGRAKRVLRLYVR